MASRKTKIEIFPAPNQRRLVFGLCLLLAFAIIAVYFQTAYSGFVDHDDQVYIKDNPYVPNGLTWQGIKWSFTRIYEANWIPIVWLSLMLDTSLYGTSPAGYHLVNAAFHIFNAVLLFWILMRFTKTLWPSFFVAAFFALHPLHVESVAWVTERKDTLSTLCWLLTMLAYIRYLEKPSRVRYLIVFVVYILGLMSKPMLVTLPFILLLMDYWPLRRFGNDDGKTIKADKLVLEKRPLIISAIIASILAFSAQQAGQAVVELNNYSFAMRIGNALISYCQYIIKMFMPVRLACFYPLPDKIEPSAAVAAAIFLLAVTTIAIFFGRRYRYLFVGWFWYIITLLPVIGIVQIGSQAMADRYTYVPLTGIFIMLVWGIADICGKFHIRRFFIASVGSLVLVTLAVLSFIQTSYWHDSFSLFTHAAAVTKDNYYAYRGIGLHYARNGQMQQAKEAFNRVAEINRQNPYILFKIAENMEYFNQTEEAVRFYNEVLRLVPDEINAILAIAIIEEKEGHLDRALELYLGGLGKKPDDIKLQSGLGSIYLKMGRVDDAIDEFTKVMETSVNSSVCGNLALAYMQKGLPEKAIEYFGMAIDLDDASAEAHYNLANFYFDQGDLNQAIVEYKKAVQYNPRYKNAYINLAMAFARLDNMDIAIENFTKASKIDPDDVGIRFNLARAFINKGLFDNAANQYRRILTLDPNNQQASESLKNLFKQ